MHLSAGTLVVLKTPMQIFVDLADIVRLMSAAHPPNERRWAKHDGQGVPDSPDEIERQIETDPTLIPRRPSALLVEPSVLDQAELEALLLDLGPAAGRSDE